MPARLASSLVLLLAAAPGAAQSPARPGAPRPDTTVAYRLRGVEVAAARGATDAALATARVTAFTPADAAATGAANVADLLDRRGTADVRPYGPAGLAAVSVRGAGAAGTAVFLDGLRLTDPQLGQVDLRLVPTALLGGAALVHGPAAAWDGADAVGGSLHLAPRRAAPGVRATAEGGSFGTRRADAAAGARAGPWAATVAASLDRTGGAFPYRDAAAFPPRTVRRAGADARFATALVAAAHAGRTAATRAGLWLADADRGLPGSAGSAPQGERQADGLARVWAAHDRAFGPTRLHLAGYAHAARLRYRNAALALDETARPRLVGAEATVERPFGRGVDAGAGLAYSAATSRHPSLAGGAVDHVVAAFAHGTARRGPLLLAPAVRVDAYRGADRAYTPVSPRLGGRLALPAGFAVKAAVARSFRAPTLNDRFWRGAGRADLRPERAWGLDGGVAVDRGPLRAEATAYALALRDGIVWGPDAAGTWRPANVRRARTHGAEATAAWAGAGRLRPSLDVAYAWTRARDRSDPAAPTYGRMLPYVPRETLRLGASVAPGPAALDLNLRYTGRRFATADETLPLRPFAVIDAGLRLARGPWAVGVRLENALGARYEAVQGYPMPGRAAYLRLAYTH